MSFVPLICEEIDDILFPGANIEELLQGRRYKNKGREFHRDYRFCKKRKHPWMFKHQKELNTSEVKTGKDAFQVNLNVQQFFPEEITVKTVNNLIVIEGKQEEREDEHGCISRHFIRKYKLAEEYDSTNVQSHLSSDGVLIITCAKKVPESNEQEIPIKLTGPVKRVAMNHTEDKGRKNQENAEEMIII